MRRISVNERFFQNWSSEMAYVLGYFMADGNLTINPQGSHYIEFTSVDRDLLIKIQQLLSSKQRLGIRKGNGSTQRDRYRLQIGSKKISQDLTNLGLVSRKGKLQKLPQVPKKYLSHFVRGYFDGDGCVSFGFYKRANRKKPAAILLTRFTSGNKRFLKKLFIVLRKEANLKGGFIYRGKGAFHLCFSIRDSLRLYKFMYGGISKSHFLLRKYNTFQKALNHWGGSSVG